MMEEFIEDDELLEMILLHVGRAAPPPGEQEVSARTLALVSRYDFIIFFLKFAFAFSFL